MIRAIFQLLMTLAKLFTSVEALVRLVKFAWALLLKLFRRAAIVVLEPTRADQECGAVRQEFATKQRITLERLGAMGVRFPQKPQGTFYAFGSIEDLPGPLDDGERFMHAGFGIKCRASVSRCWKFLVASAALSPSWRSTFPRTTSSRTGSRTGCTFF